MKIDLNIRADHRPTYSIWVGCLAAYNAGAPHGRWIDATQGADGIRDDIAAMLADSPIPDAEEYAIMDSENFAPCRVAEYEDIDHVAAMAEFIDEFPEYGAALLDEYCGDLDDARQAADGYRGTYSSDAEMAEEFAREAGEIPDERPNWIYIDWERSARDLMMELTRVRGADGQLHYFWPN